MKATTNFHSLLRVTTALSFAAMLMSHALANPSQETAEPRRIFDAEKEQFVPNPDYREPVTVKQAAQNVKPLAEPRRIFNAEAERFVINPAYHAPAATVKAVPRSEPRRIFEAEKERFVINPDYRGH